MLLSTLDYTMPRAFLGLAEGVLGWVGALASLRSMSLLDPSSPHSSRLFRLSVRGRL